MVVVAWSDGKLGVSEANLIRDRARSLPEIPREWVNRRLRVPPGPYFRCQVSHLLAFMANTWSGTERDGCQDWSETGERWARELIADQGIFRRMFGGIGIFHCVGGRDAKAAKRLSRALSPLKGAPPPIRALHRGKPPSEKKGQVWYAGPGFWLEASKAPSRSARSSPPATARARPRKAAP